LVDKVDLKVLPKKFLKVEKNYERTKAEVVSKNFSGSESAKMVWNLSQYDLMVVSAEKTKHQEKDFLEDDLMRKLRKRQGMVAPEEIYADALELTEGDRFKAMLLAHNALRLTGRANQTSTSNYPEIDIKNMVGKKFFNEYIKQHPDANANQIGEAYLSQKLQPMTDDKKDTTGKYYHLFGTMAATETGDLGKTSVELHKKLTKIREFLRFKKGTYDKWSYDKSGIDIAEHLKAENPAYTYDNPSIFEFNVLNTTPVN